MQDCDWLMYVEEDPLWLINITVTWVNFENSMKFSAEWILYIP